MQPIRTSLVKSRTSATEVLECDLPVNPVSHLIVAIEGYNVTDEATLAEILAFLNSVKCLHDGRTVFSLESEQIAALNWKLFGAPCFLHNNVATDNAQRILGLIVPFGRKLYDPNECFPASKKGEFKLKVDLTALGTSIDNGLIHIDCVELKDATPKQYLKSSGMTVSAPGSTGEHNVDLAIGNRYDSLLLQHTTYTLTSSHTFGVSDVSLLKNNVEFWYSNASTPCMMAERMLLSNNIPRDIAAFGQNIPDKFTVMDFNPLKDDSTLLETEGLSDLKLRINYGVSEAIGVVKLELVTI